MEGFFPKLQELCPLPLDLISNSSQEHQSSRITWYSLRGNKQNQGFWLAVDLSDPRLMIIWQSRVPNKIKVFGWLLYLDILNTRSNLHHMNIIMDQNCPRCSHLYEKTHHLFFTCLTTRRVWRAAGTRPKFHQINEPWASTMATHLPPTITNSSSWLCSGKFGTRVTKWFLMGCVYHIRAPFAPSSGSLQFGLIG